MSNFQKDVQLLADLQGLIGSLQRPPLGGVHRRRHQSAMSCYGCACDHCLYNAELEAWYMTPGEVQNAEDICFCCDECKHYDGDFSKRSQWRPDCPRHKFPEKYLEMQRIVEQRRARAAETRRRNFQIIKGGKP